MPHRLISVSSPKYGEVPLKLVQESEDSNLTILEALQPFGSIRFTITNHKKFRLWHATYRITKPTRLIITINRQYLGFLFALKNNPNYNLKGLSPMSIQEHQCDIFYTPSINFEYNFDSETYIVCGFNFSTNSFIKWSNLFDPLNTLISHISENTAYRLKPSPINTTPRILVPLSHILQCEFTGNKKTKFLSFKTTELTFYILQNTISSNDHSKLGSAEFELMTQVKDHLLRNLTNPGTIHQIALNFGLNDFKLKTYFKRAFGTSIYAFILAERLQKAQALITDTNTPLKQVAEIAGYSDLSAFSNAFHNKFGYRPSTLRKKLEK